METLSDDDSSDLISLKELNTKTIIDLENQTERSPQDQADLKVEIPNQTEPKIEKAEIPLIDLNSGDNSQSRT